MNSCHQRGCAARLAQGHHGRPADEFRTHNNSALSHGFVLEVHEGLQLPRGEHTRGAVAGDPAGRPRAFPCTGGENHGTGLHSLTAGRAGDHQCGVTVPSGGHGRRGDLYSGILRSLHQLACVLRPGHEGAQVAQPVPGVGAVAGHTAGDGLAFEDEHGLHPRQLQTPRGIEPGRAGSNDDDVGGDLIRTHSPASFRIASTSAPQ